MDTRSRPSNERTESVGSRSTSDQGHQKKNSLHNKNDPNLALTEDQPMAHMGTGTSVLRSLNRMQHRDQFGRPITEPDLSNPTRYRFERPLDTIKSFESDIARSHKERQKDSVLP